MPKDPRVDLYIAQAKPFAKPILERLRAIAHKGCPDVVETIKWGQPSFEHNGLMAGMAAFKEHCVFGFWKGELITDKTTGKSLDRSPMSSFGCIKSVADLPAQRVLVDYVKQAARLNDDGVKAPMRKTPPRPKPPVTTPKDLTAALKNNAKARVTYVGFSPSAKRDYVEWLTEAKTDETRARRLAQAVAWMAEGKRRNWKYER